MEFFGLMAFFMVMSINIARNKSIYHFIKEKNDGINFKK